MRKKRTPQRRNKKNVKKESGPGVGKKILLFAAIIIGVLVLYNTFTPKRPNPAADMGLEVAIDNYGRDIKLLSSKFNLPPEYLMALIMLECSGRKEVPPRFEKGVYNKLVAIQDHKRASLESITINDIADANDDALRNLASSWGPFQLMGYKCLHLGIKIKDLRGPQSLHYGVQWIDKTYGEYLRKGRFEDAFHIHNTGHEVPKSGKYNTYDPTYIPRGLEYMEYFKNNL